MTTAKVKVSFNTYYTLWEKAVKQSMKEMECVSRRELAKTSFFGFKKTYTDKPFTDFNEYWKYMSRVYPWNEIVGFKTVAEWNNRSTANIEVSLYLLTCTINRAKRWDAENE